MEPAILYDYLWHLVPGPDLVDASVDRVFAMVFYSWKPNTFVIVLLVCTERLGTLCSQPAPLKEPSGTSSCLMQRPGVN